MRTCEVDTSGEFRNDMCHAEDDIFGFDGATPPESAGVGRRAAFGYGYGLRRHDRARHGTGIGRTADD